MSQLAMDPDLVRVLQHQVAATLGQEARARAAAGHPPLTRDDEQQYALSLIEDLVRQHIQDLILTGAEVPPQRNYEERLADAVYSRMYLAGVLQPLLDDSDVENININNSDQVFVSRAGGGDPELLSSRLWSSDEEFVSAIQLLAAHAPVNARPWTMADPVLDVRLADGSRLSAIMGAGLRPSASIRRNRFTQMFLPGLVQLQTLSPRLATFMQASVAARHNILVSGATNSGKTTVLRALLNVLEPGERLITIELAQELLLSRHAELHPNLLEWEERQPDSEGHGGITMAELVRRSLRFDPDRVVVGEILGDEVTALLNAMTQGNGGSLGTVHAHSASGAIDRLAGYALQAERSQAIEVTHALVGGAVDFIVHMRRDRLSGRRVVAELIELTGFDGRRAVWHHLFNAPGRGDQQGLALRNNEGLSERHLEELADAGYQDDAALWGEAF